MNIFSCIVVKIKFLEIRPIRGVLFRAFLVPFRGL